MFDLTPDVRYFYLCLLTNPERNTTPAFKCSDRLLSAYTGYNSETINICRNVLVVKGFIDFIDGYYILNNQDYVEPTKGKLSQSLYEKSIEELPENIRVLLRSGTGATREYIYKDKDNNKDTDNNIEKTGENLKVSFGEFGKVKLTTEEHKKLIERMGEKNVSYIIAELDTYIASKGARYKSHYATLLNWARRKYQESHKKNNPKAVQL